MQPTSYLTIAEVTLHKAVCLLLYSSLLTTGSQLWGFRLLLPGLVFVLPATAVCWGQEGAGVAGGTQEAAGAGSKWVWSRFLSSHCTGPCHPGALLSLG